LVSLQHGLEPPRRGDYGLPAAKLELLTDAERTVLTVLARTMRIDDVVTELGRSKNTINNHLKSARAKLGGTDSLSVARMYVASQHSHRVASHALAIDPEPPFGSPSEQELADTPGPAIMVLQEERAVFDYGPLALQVPAPTEGKRPADDLTPPRAVFAPKLQTILNLAILILALLALTPYAGRAIQGLANLTNPPR
jgi:DNA-binding CsgD family transcriptional regulator